MRVVDGGEVTEAAGDVIELYICTHVRQPPDAHIAPVVTRPPSRPSGGNSRTRDRHRGETCRVPVHGRFGPAHATRRRTAHRTRCSHPDNRPRPADPPTGDAAG